MAARRRCAEKGVNMGRQENIEVFEDTVYVYNRNLTLIKAIEWGIEHQQIFPEGREEVGKQAHSYEKTARIVVSSKRTLEAAAPYAYAGKRSAF